MCSVSPVIGEAISCSVSAASAAREVVFFAAAGELGSRLMSRTKRPQDAISKRKWREG